MGERKVPMCMKDAIYDVYERLNRVLKERNEYLETLQAEVVRVRGEIASFSEQLGEVIGYMAANGIEVLETTTEECNENG